MHIESTLLPWTDPPFWMQGCLSWTLELGAFHFILSIKVASDQAHVCMWYWNSIVPHNLYIFCVLLTFLCTGVQYWVKFTWQIKIWSLISNRKYLNISNNGYFNVVGVHCHSVIRIVYRGCFKAWLGRSYSKALGWTRWLEIKQERSDSDGLYCNSKSK